MCSHDRDTEYGRVYVNDEICWNREIKLSMGSHQCGETGSNNNWKELGWQVQCGTVSVGGKLILRIDTDLDQLPSDESFAIDNVAVTRLTACMYVMCVCM